jgi:hypothetical protein
MEKVMSKTKIIMNNQGGGESALQIKGAAPNLSIGSL